MSTAESPRTLVVGLESAALPLIEQWIHEGSLPFLGSMLRACPLVTLHTPIHVLQPCVWPSLLTGASPGRHGRYQIWSQIETGSYDFPQPPAMLGSLRRYEEFLADRGIGAALVDIPTDIRIPGHRGLHVVDWGTEYRFGRCEIEPRKFAARIAREVAAHPIPSDWHTGDSQPEHLELARRLEEGVRARSAFTGWLLEQPDLRHVFMVFSEMHKAAHWFWKYMDRNHVDYEDSPPALRDGVRHIYEAVDRELAAIAEQLGPQDNLVVLSEQGMGPNYRGDHLVEQFLQTLGLLVRDGPPPPRGDVLPRDGRHAPRAAAPSALRRAVTAAKARIPRALKAPLHALRYRSNIDWRQTRVFQLPTDRNTYLRVNLRGREPQGCVEPGAEYEALLDHLETELRALRDGATGKPAVVEIFRIRTLFHGDYADGLPDLAVQWASDTPVDSLQSASVGTLSLAVRELRSGNHRPEGFLLARGPAFIAGPQRLVGDMLQIPATLLRLHGVPRPAQFEQAPLPIFASQAVGIAPISLAAAVA
jgi:predicted AlkP superfamily phosphohydrolase/phosphomutase